MILAIAVAVVCIWRGVWGLLDIYLLPGNPTMSLCISIFIGLGIFVLLGKKFMFLL